MAWESDYASDGGGGGLPTFAGMGIGGGGHGSPFIDWSSPLSVVTAGPRALAGLGHQMGDLVEGAWRGIPGLIGAAGVEGWHQAYGTIARQADLAQGNIDLGEYLSGGGPVPIDLEGLGHGPTSKEFAKKHPLIGQFAQSGERTVRDVGELTGAGINTLTPPFIGGGHLVPDVGELGQGPGLLGNTAFAKAVAPGGGGALGKTVEDAMNFAIVAGPVAKTIGTAAEGAVASSEAANATVANLEKAATQATKEAATAVTDSTKAAMEAQNAAMQARAAAASGDPVAAAQSVAAEQQANAAMESMRQAQEYAQTAGAEHTGPLEEARTIAEKAAADAERLKGHARTARLVADLGQRTGASPFTAFEIPKLIKNYAGPAARAIVGDTLGERWITPLADKAEQYSVNNMVKRMIIGGHLRTQTEVAPVTTEANFLSNLFERDPTKQAVAIMGHTYEGQQFRQLLANYPRDVAIEMFDRTMRDPNTGASIYTPEVLQLGADVWGPAEAPAVATGARGEGTVTLYRGRSVGRGMSPGEEAYAGRWFTDKPLAAARIAGPEGQVYSVTVPLADAEQYATAAGSAPDQRFAPVQGEYVLPKELAARAVEDPTATVRSQMLQAHLIEKFPEVDRRFELGARDPSGDWSEADLARFAREAGTSLEAESRVLFTPDNRLTDAGQRLLGSPYVADETRRLAVALSENRLPPSRLAAEAPVEAGPMGGEPLGQTFPRISSDPRVAEIQNAINQARERYGEKLEPMQTESYARGAGEDLPVRGGPLGEGAWAQIEHNVEASGQPRIEGLKQWQRIARPILRGIARDLKEQEASGKRLTAAGKRFEKLGITAEELRDPQKLMDRVFSPALRVATETVAEPGAAEALSAAAEPKLAAIGAKLTEGNVNPAIIARELTSEIANLAKKDPEKLSEIANDLVDRAYGGEPVPKATLPNLATAGAASERLGAGVERARIGTQQMAAGEKALASGQELYQRAREKMGLPTRDPGPAVASATKRYGASVTRLNDLLGRVEAARTRTEAAGEKAAKGIKSDVTHASIKKAIRDLRRDHQNILKATAKEAYEEALEAEVLPLWIGNDRVSRMVWDKELGKSVKRWYSKERHVPDALREDPILDDPRFVVRGPGRGNDMDLITDRANARGGFHSTGPDGSFTEDDWVALVRDIKKTEAEGKVGLDKGWDPKKYDIATFEHLVSDQYGPELGRQIAEKVMFGHPNDSAAALFDTLSSVKRGEMIGSAAAARRTAAAAALEADRALEVERGGPGGVPNEPRIAAPAPAPVDPFIQAYNEARKLNRSATEPKVLLQRIEAEYNKLGVAEPFEDALARNQDWLNRGATGTKGQVKLYRPTGATEEGVRGMYSNAEPPPGYEPPAAPTAPTAAPEARPNYEALDTAGKALYRQLATEGQAGVQGQIVERRQGAVVRAATEGTEKAREQGQREGGILGAAAERMGQAEKQLAQGEARVESAQPIIGAATEATQSTMEKMGKPFAVAYGRSGGAHADLVRAASEYDKIQQSVERGNAKLAEERAKMERTPEAQARKFRPAWEFARRARTEFTKHADELDAEHIAGAKAAGVELEPGAAMPGDMWRTAWAELQHNAEEATRQVYEEGPQFVIGDKGFSGRVDRNVLGREKGRTQYVPGGVRLPVITKTGTREPGLGLFHPQTYADMGRRIGDRIGRVVANETGQQIIDAVGGGQLADVLAERLNRPPEEIAALGNTKAGRAELVQHMKDNKLSAWNISDKKGALLPDAKIGGGSLVVPTHVWETFAKHEGDILGAGSRVMKAYDRGLKGWKTSVLYMTGRYWTSLILGDMMQTMIGGGMSPVDYYGRHLPRAIELNRMARTGVLDEKALAKLSPEVRAALDEHGGYVPGAVRERGYVQSELGRAAGDTRTAKTPWGKAAEAGYRAQSWLDDANRVAVWMKQLEKGLDRVGLEDFRKANPELAHLSDAKIQNEAAIRMSIRSLGDYSNMTTFERGVVRRIVPFYSWLRHITQLSGNLAIHNPVRVAWMLALPNLFSGDEAPVDWLGSAFPIGGDRFIRTPSINPFQTVADIANPDNPFSMITPAASIAAASRGYDLRNGKMFARPPGTSGGFDAGEMLYYLGQQLPQTKAAVESLPALIGHDAVARYKSGQPIIPYKPTTEQQWFGTDTKLPGALAPWMPVLGPRQEKIPAGEIAAAELKKREQAAKARARYEARRRGAAARS